LLINEIEKIHQEEPQREALNEIKNLKKENVFTTEKVNFAHWPAAAIHSLFIIYIFSIFYRF